MAYYECIMCMSQAAALLLMERLSGIAVHDDQSVSSTARSCCFNLGMGGPHLDDAHVDEACWFMLQAGFTNVLHLEGGLSQWRYDGYPVESD